MIHISAGEAFDYDFRDAHHRNEMRGINCVVYDITSKPPGTIE